MIQDNINENIPPKNVPCKLTLGVYINTISHIQKSNQKFQKLWYFPSLFEKESMISRANEIICNIIFSIDIITTDFIKINTKCKQLLFVMLALTIILLVGSSLWIQFFMLFKQIINRD